MMTDNNMTLEKRLLLAQQALKAPKGQYNSFGKYHYRSAEDILEALKPVLASFGLTLYLTDDLELIGEWHYIKATATVTDCTNSLSVKAFAREPMTKKGMDDSQITGTASSYARKYALNGLFLIDDNKDADTNEHQNQMNNAPQQAQPAKEPDFKADYTMYAHKIMELVPGTTMEMVHGMVSSKTGLDPKVFGEHQREVIGALVAIYKEAKASMQPIQPNDEVAQQRKARAQAKPQGQQGYNNPFAK